MDPNAPATFYCIVEKKGVYKTTDGGVTWNPSSHGILAPYQIWDIAISRSSPPTLLVSANHTVFRSVDGGESWNPAAEIDPGIINVFAFAPEEPSTVYAGSYDSGVYKSLDAGVHWRAVNRGLVSGKLAYPDVFALGVDPTDASTVYAGGEFGVYKTTDGGSDWKEINEGLASPHGSARDPSPVGVRSFAFNPAAPATVYMGGFSMGAFRSADGGENWSSITPSRSSLLMNSPVTAIRFDPIAPNIIYEGTLGAGVLVSLDGGDHWSEMNDGLSSLRVVGLMVNPHDSSMVYAATYGGGFFIFSINAG